MEDGEHQTVTVTSYHLNYPPDTTDYEPPSPGDQCVQVNLSLRNGDSIEWDEPLYEMTLVDQNGVIYQQAFVTCGNTSSITGLAPGGKATATMYFEVPKTSKVALTWTPNTLNSNSYYSTPLP